MTIEKPAAVSGETNAAVLSERLRVAAILESPEGKRNVELATELALRTTLEPEAAKAILARAPSANPYLAAMALEGPIGLSAVTANLSTDPRAARLEEIKASAAAYNASRGFKPAKDEA